MEKETCYWIISTLIQTFGAILSIFGFFLVFRLQSLNRHRDTLYKQLSNLASEYGTGRLIKALFVCEDTVEDVLNNLNNKINKWKNEGTNESAKLLSDLVNPIENQLNIINQHKRQIRCFSCPLLFLMAILIGIWIFLLFTIDQFYGSCIYDILI